MWASRADVGAEWQRMLFANLAGLAATPARSAGLALTVAPDASLVEVWIDWISLVVGPDAPPPMLRPAGLGAFGDTPLEAANATHDLELSGVTGAALDQLATTLLAAAARPVPRHIGRTMDVATPPTWYRSSRRGGSPRCACSRTRRACGSRHSTRRTAV